MLTCMHHGTPPRNDPLVWKVGEVKKLAPSSLADIAKEIATDADKFTISFPQDLKVTSTTCTLLKLQSLKIVWLVSPLCLGKTLVYSRYYYCTTTVLLIELLL